MNFLVINLSRNLQRIISKSSLYRLLGDMAITNQEKLSSEKFVVSPAERFTQSRHIMTELPLTLPHQNIIYAVPQLTARILPGVFVHITLFKISVHNRQAV